MLEPVSHSVLQYDDIFSTWQRSILPSVALYKYVGHKAFVLAGLPSAELLWLNPEIEPAI